MTHEGHAALGQVLEREGMEYEPIHGKYGDVKQPGYIVHIKDDGQVEKLKGIAKRFGQEAIVHSDAGKHQYIYTAGPQEGLATPPSSGQDFYDQEPENNFSTLYGPGGEPLGHFSYNLDFDHDLIPHGKGQTVEAPEAARQVLKAAIESYRGVLIDLRKREMDKAAGKGKNFRTCPDHKTAGCGCTKKYEVESHNSTRSGPQPLHEDVSAQGTLKQGVNPNTHNISSGGKYNKTEEGDYAHIRGVRQAESRELSQIPMRDPAKGNWPKDDGRPVPSIAEERAAAAGKTRKTENPMKLHDLMKSQAAKGASLGAGTPNNPAREGSQVNVATSGKKPDWQPMGTAMKGEGSMDKAQCTCGSPGCKWCGKPAPKAGNEQGEHGGSPKQSHAPGEPRREGPGPTKKAEFPTSGPAHQGVPVSGGGTQPTIGGQIHSGGGRTIGQSIFQRVPLGFESGEQLQPGAAPVVKAETNAHKNMKANGGHIKLGKQEFVISRSNQSDAKKRLVETNPVKDSKVPAGKETGWRDNGEDVKEYVHEGSVGNIKGNAPKAGPDQKNAPENSAVTGTVPKSSGKNDLIEKAAEAWHKKQPPKREETEESTRPEPRDAQDDEGLHDPMGFEKGSLLGKAAESFHKKHGLNKVGASMAAPKAPSAAGMGSPKLAAAPPKAPPAAAPGGATMGKALMPFSAQHAGAAADHAALAGGAMAQAPKATPKSPDQYDNSLFQPKGPVHSGLELGASAGAVRGNVPLLPGTGVTPRPVSPATKRGITGFMGKGELCKSCGKAHAIGKCQ